MSYPRCLMVPSVVPPPPPCAHTGSQTLYGGVESQAWPQAGSYAAAGPVEVVAITAHPYVARY